MLTRLIPKIFFDRKAQGIALFVDCLGFQVRHSDDDLTIVERDGAKAYGNAEEVRGVRRGLDSGWDARREPES